MAERETTKVTTPVGKIEVTLKAWLTGGEKMEMLKIQKEDSIDWMLKTIIITPDIEAIKVMHGKDFDFLLLAMNKVAEDSNWTEKKN